jgi:hypothetical protein
VLFEVLDEGVSAWEQQGLVTGVAPTHQIGRRTVRPADLEYLGVVIGLADVVSLDHDSIANDCAHFATSCWSLIISTQRHRR